MQEIAYIIEFMAESVADKIKDRREKSGLSQAEFAHRASIPLRSYIDYENGVRAIPHDRLVRIARRLGCELSDLDPEAKQPALVPEKPVDLHELAEEAAVRAAEKAFKAMSSKQDDPEMIRLREENERLRGEVVRLESDVVELKEIIRAIPKEIYYAWPLTGELAHGLSLFFLTGRRGHLRTRKLSQAFRERMEKAYRFVGLKPLPRKPRLVNE